MSGPRSVERGRPALALALLAALLVAAPAGAQDAAPTLAFDPKGFTPPDLDGLRQEEATSADTTPLIEGDDTDVENYVAADGTLTYRAVTNGVPWAIAVVPQGDRARGEVLRDPTCSGTYSEKSALAEQRPAPVCAVVGGTNHVDGVDFKAAGFAPPSTDGLQQTTVVAADLVPEIGGKESEVAAFADGQGGSVYRFSTAGRVWAMGVEGIHPADAYMVRDPDCSGRFSERMPLQPGLRMGAPICAAAPLLPAAAAAPTPAASEPPPVTSGDIAPTPAPAADEPPPVTSDEIIPGTQTPTARAHAPNATRSP